MTPPVSRKNNMSSVLRPLSLFKMIELMVVILVLAVVYYVLIDRVIVYRGQYESAEVSWTIATINTARTTALARREIYRALGKQEMLAADKTPENPMHYLNPPPRNYIGEICAPEPQTIPRGSWYFDRCNSWLVYVVGSEKFFAQEHPKILKFNVESLRLLTDPA